MEKRFSRLDEDATTYEETIWFHGSGFNSTAGKGSLRLHRPTVDRPLYVASDPEFAARHMSPFDTHKSGTFFIFKIKDDFDSFYLHDGESFDRLGLPAFIRTMVVDRRMALFDAFNMSTWLFGACWKMFLVRKEGEYGPYYGFDQAGFRSAAWDRNTLLRIEQEACRKNGYPVPATMEEFEKKYNYDKLLPDDETCADFIEWVKKLPFDRDYPLGARNLFSQIYNGLQGFSGLSMGTLYDLAANVYRKIKKLGYDSVYTNDLGSETLVLFDLSHIEWISDRDRPLNRNKTDEFLKFVEQIGGEITDADIASFFNGR